MPFTKIGRNRWKSPSGRTWTTRQMKAYEATAGFTKKSAKPRRRQR